VHAEPMKQHKTKLVIVI